MAYLRWGMVLPSGKRSNSYIFGDNSGLINFGQGKRVSYDEIRELLKSDDDSEIKNKLGRGLKLKGEELEVVCERLFIERDRGEWDNPFEFERVKPKSY